jgi:hypothetical protein
VALAELQARRMSVKKSWKDLRSCGLTRLLVPDRHSAGCGLILSWMNCSPVGQSGERVDLCFRVKWEWQMSELEVERGRWCFE